MKRLLILCIASTLLACQGEPKDYVILSGKIENSHESKTLRIFQGQIYEKTITIKDDGTFKDTLKIIPGDYNFQHGKEFGQIYLENGSSASFETDYNSFIDSIVFKGDNSDTNNFTIQSFLIAKNRFTDKLMTTGTEKEVNQAIESYKAAYEDVKAKYKKVDSTHIAVMDNNIDETIQRINQFMASKLATMDVFPAGAPSPTFENYENHAGGKMSLSDFKGKYVYFDMWATWCGPCIKEIPSLKEVEKQFKGKNIEFVSISLDEGRGYKGDKAAAYEGWKKMVKEKELGGIQLMADNGFASDFVRKYRINGIPRFILVDPEGNIVNANAPRPSNPELVNLLNELNL